MESGWITVTYKKNKPKKPKPFGLCGFPECDVPTRLYRADCGNLCCINHLMNHVSGYQCKECGKKNFCRCKMASPMNKIGYCLTCLHHFYDPFCDSCKQCRDKNYRNF